MKLINYKIIEIKSEEKNIVILFNFDTGEETHTIHCGDVSFDDFRMEDTQVNVAIPVLNENNEPTIDETGNIITEVVTQTVSKPVSFTNKKPNIDLSNIEQFKEDVLVFANAYISGRELEKPIEVHSDITSLIGQNIKEGSSKAEVKPA